MRFILPVESTLTSTGKIPLKVTKTREGNTLLSGYVTTSPGDSSALTFTYRLPKSLCDTKTHFYKQAGLKNLTVIEKNNGTLVSQKHF